MACTEAGDATVRASIGALATHVLVRCRPVRDVQAALESMNLSSWSPRLPRPLPTITADVKGWLVSPQHPMASACHWSVYNYLLATPDSSLMFLDHIAALGCRPLLGSSPEGVPDEFKERLRLSRIKVTGQ